MKEETTMYWQVHWMNYEDPESGSFSPVMPYEGIHTCKDYPEALGLFIMNLTDSNVARVWVTVHRTDDDSKGTIMHASSMSWNDRIIIEEE